MGGPDREFSGEYEHALDAKGRVSMPARFRDVLRKAGEEEVAVVRFYFGKVHCVTVFRVDAWEEALERLVERPDLTREERAALEHAVRHQAKFIPVDEQGRIVLPPEAREYAGLRKEVMIVGDGRKFHIVDRETYRAASQSLRAVLEANPELVRAIYR